MNVVVIEHEAQARGDIDAYLTRGGHDVRVLADARDLDRVMALRPVDVVVCDSDLPGESGYSVSARLRRADDIGVILLTASQRREDRILALSVGVDHVLHKPLDLHELGFTVSNLYRRMRADARLPRADTARMKLPATAQAAWRFDLGRWTLTAPGGHPVQLSMTEYIVLRELLAHSGQPVVRDDLVALLGRHGIRVYSRNLDAMISRLRRKAQSGGGNAKLPIQSARNVGYVFTGASETVGHSQHANDVADAARAA